MTYRFAQLLDRLILRTQRTMGGCSKKQLGAFFFCMVATCEPSVALGNELQEGLEQSCLRSAKKRGEPTEQTRSLCACMAQESIESETLTNPELFPQALLQEMNQRLVIDWDEDWFTYDPEQPGPLSSTGISREEADLMVGAAFIVWGDCMQKLGLAEDYGLRWESD